MSTLNGATVLTPLPPPVGVVHADLKLFLETNLPVSGKKKAALGVSDAKVGAALQEEFNLSIQTGGVVAEISRGTPDAPPAPFLDAASRKLKFDRSGLW